MRNSWIQITALVLFLLGQALSVAHAAEHGGHDHEHEGVVCLALIHDEQEGLVPATGGMLPSVGVEVPQTSQIPELLRSVQASALRPPPTGPPSV